MMNPWFPANMILKIKFNLSSMKILSQRNVQQFCFHFFILKISVYIDKRILFFYIDYNDIICIFFSARGKGRGRTKNDDEENGAGGRPSGPSTLFDFLESKMGVLSIQGG